MRKVLIGALAVGGTVASGGLVSTPAAHAETTPACPTSQGAPSTTFTAMAQLGSDGKVTVTAQPATGQSDPARYHFSFGDGLSTDQASPVVVHQYGYNGFPFSLQVTATDASGASTTSPLCAVWVDNVKNSVHRYAGGDRYLTSSAVSQWVWANAKDDTTQRRRAKSVVLASGATYADALPGVPLAAYRQGPLLLTEPTRLTETTRQEIERVLPQGSTVYLLGGTSALSPAVASQLVSDGYKVTRYGGADRYATAMQIATEGLDNASSVVVATGTDFADALAAGPVATSDDMSVNGKPAAIILTRGVLMPDAKTAAYVRARFATSVTTSPATGGPAPSHVLAIGGPAYCAVAYAAYPPGGPCDPRGMSLLADHGLMIAGIPGQPGPTYYGLVGGNRYRTAEAVSWYTSHAISTDPRLNMTFSGRFGLASGTDFPDALTGGAALAVLHSPILLTARDYFPDGTADILSKSLHPSQGVGTTYQADIIGGPAAIAPSLEAQLDAMYHG